MPKEASFSLPKGTKVPDHIALILDGNRRWARARGLKPWEGHKAGYMAVNKLARAARNLGVHTFTIWAFSTENWERPKEEIDAIFKLLKLGLKEFKKDAHKEKVRLIHLGRKERFPPEIAKQIKDLEESTQKYTGHILNLALDYGGRDEIIRATRKIVESGVSPDKIDEKLFESCLDTKDQPYPYVDLFIRTSGEQRTSGLLPWQMAYAEYYWDPDHLPDFTPEKLKEAILDYSRRRRRFGGNDSVEHLAFKPEVVANLELAWWRLRKIPAGTRFRDYAANHLKEQFGLSKSLAKDAAKYMIEAMHEEGNGRNWDRAIGSLKKFYTLIRDELKLAFEPSIVASLQVKFWKDVADREGIESVGDAEETAKKLYAEVYRISLLQAAKAAHLRVLANIERNLAEKGLGEHHWKRAEDYLQKFYAALNERVA
jgi:undecaprenyl diphosphate synthase